MNRSVPTKLLPDEALTLSRRQFVVSTVGLSLTTLGCHASVSQKPVEPDRVRVMDTHVHFYDPTRAEGIPWPKPDNKLLYRRVMPADYTAALGDLKVDHVIVVEASSWLEDNQWLLDLAAREKLIAGVIGHLNTEAPAFASQLKRFAANPLFRGIRVGGGTVTKKGDDAAFLAAVRGLVDQGLTLDVIGNASMLVPVTRLATRFPHLRIVLNHLADPGDPAKGIPEKWREGIHSASEHKNIYCKVSRLVELVKNEEPGKSPTSLEYYRNVLDTLWNLMGPDRLLYGSNWPVCERGAPLPSVQALAMEYFSLKGRDALERVCWRNAQAAYFPS